MTSEVPNLLALLKRLYRQKDIQYRDAAEQLGLSEPTIKRNFAGRGLTLGRLEGLCRVAGVRLSDLHAMLANEAKPRSGRLTLTQEAGLSGDLVAAFILYLLRSGWRPRDVASELGLPADRMFRHLRTLERLKLIDILSEDTVRLRVAETPDWMPGGPIRTTIDRSLRALFDRGSDPATAGMWEFDTIKISQTHVGRLAATASVRARGLISRCR